MPKAVIIDGKSIAKSIRSEIAAEVAELTAAHSGKRPGLGSIICSERKDSHTYMRLKHMAAAECGFLGMSVQLPADVAQARLEEEIVRLNADPECHGIVLQLPLPPHMHAHATLMKISPAKDVDALLPISVGLLHCRAVEPPFLPCTPAGVIELLLRSGVRIGGRRAVVLGRSNIVGAPLAALLTRHNATVTVVHSHTPPRTTEDIVRDSDIVVSAVGKPKFVRGEWIKEGAAVIDVGTTPVDDPTRKSGYRLVGDVCFDEAKWRAGHITRVPGGVGPMTIAMLLRNTLNSFKRSICDSQSDHA